MADPSVSIYSSLYTPLVKLLATYLPDQQGPPGSYWLAFLLDDARTSFGRPRRVRDVGSLVRIIRKLGGDEDLTLHALRSWGHGSSWINPNTAQLEWIRG